LFHGNKAGQVAVLLGCFAAFFMLLSVTKSRKNLELRRWKKEKETYLSQLKQQNDSEINGNIAQLFK